MKVNLTKYEIKCIRLAMGSKEAMLDYVVDLDKEEAKMLKTFHRIDKKLNGGIK